MSLIQQAEQGNLPLLQNLDRETLQWIQDNESNELKNVDIVSVAKSIDIRKISKFTPLPSWFISQNKVNSLHGIRHLMRVTTYAWLLSKEVDKIQKNNLLVAAVLHDIRRLNDKADEGHSARAAKWYQQKRNEIIGKFKIDTVNDEIIIELIKSHELNSKDLKFRKLFDIIKTSDALDRYIQPKKKWWLDDKYLNLQPSLEIKAYAFRLVIKSEEKYLDGIDSKEAVLSSLKDLQN